MLAPESHEIRAASFTTSTRSQQQTNAKLNMPLEVSIQYIVQSVTVCVVQSQAEVSVHAHML